MKRDCGFSWSISWPAGTNPPVHFQKVFHHITVEMANRKALYLTRINDYLSCLGVPDLQRESPAHTHKLLAIGVLHQSLNDHDPLVGHTFKTLLALPVTPINCLFDKGWREEHEPTLLNMTQMKVDLKLGLSPHDNNWRQWNARPYWDIVWLFKVKLLAEWLTVQVNKLGLKLFPFSVDSIIHCVLYWRSKAIFFSTGIQILFSNFSLCRAKEYETSMEAKTQVPDSPYKAK